MMSDPGEIPERSRQALGSLRPLRGLRDAAPGRAMTAVGVMGDTLVTAGVWSEDLAPGRSDRRKEVNRRQAVEDSQCRQLGVCGA
eukprot:754162-Hanusia_phi.AAC.1